MFCQDTHVYLDRTFSHTHTSRQNIFTYTHTHSIYYTAHSTHTHTHAHTPDAGFDMVALAAVYDLMGTQFCDLEAFTQEMKDLGLLRGDMYKMFQLMQAQKKE
jgi:hypothetical protein